MNTNTNPSSPTHTNTPPTGEAAINYAVQQWAQKHPWSQKLASGLSLFGEHALGWVLVSLIGALSAYTQRPRHRTQSLTWILVGASAFSAHAISVILKHLIKRPRPHHPSLTVAPTAGKYSFPSSHTSAAAAAATILCAPISDKPPHPLQRVAYALILVIPMIFARLQKGVHYVSDLCAGIALGSIGAGAMLTVTRKLLLHPPQRTPPSEQ